MYKVYCSVVGNVVEKVEDKSLVLKKLNALFTKINNEFKNDMEIPFTIDEDLNFRCLFINPFSLTKIIRNIKIEIFPIQLRFGIGFEKINNAQVKNATEQLLFKSGYMSLSRIIENDTRYEMPYKRVFVTVPDNGYQSIIDLINGTISACSFIESKWTIKQREVIKLAENNTQGNIASILGISKSSVYKRISGSGYYTYLDTIDKIERLLQTLWEAYAVSF